MERRRFFRTLFAGAAALVGLVAVKDTKADTFDLGTIDELIGKACGPVEAHELVVTPEHDEGLRFYEDHVYVDQLRENYSDKRWFYTGSQWQDLREIETQRWSRAIEKLQLRRLGGLRWD